MAILTPTCLQLMTLRRITNSLLKYLLESGEKDHVRIYEETLKRNTTLIHWTRLHIDLQRGCYDVQKTSITRAGTATKVT